MGRGWQIVAGHHYATDTDKVWSYAWCYTDQIVDGVRVRIDLVERDSPSSRPRAPIATAESLAKAGLNDSSALELATKCPWLDGRAYTQNEFFTPLRSTSPQIATDVPAPNYTTEPFSNPTEKSGVESTSYVEKDGFDLLGYDLPNMPIFADNQTECESNCNQATSCLAYVFNKTYKKCFLKNSIGTLFENQVAYTGYRERIGQNPGISSLHFHNTSGLIGTFYRTLENIRYIDCATECDKDQDCRAFNFDSSNKQCTMLKSTFSAVPMPTVSSGVKGPLQ